MTNILTKIQRSWVACLVACVVTPQLVGAQVTPDLSSLAADLTSNSVQLRSAALSTIQQLPSSERGQVIRSAVIQELRREYDDLLERRATLARGGSVQPRADHGSYRVGLLRVMIAYGDQADLESLLLFLNLGHPIRDAIVAFGEAAVGPLLALVNSSETHPSRVGGAFDALGRMTELHGPRLSQAATQGILAAARKGVYETQGGLETLLPAINFALATGDPELRARVEFLASDASAVRALGVEEEYVQPVQIRARGRLAVIRR